MCNVCDARHVLDSTARGISVRFNWAEPTKDAYDAWLKRQKVARRQNRYLGESDRSNPDSYYALPRVVPEGVIPLYVEATGADPEFTLAQFRVRRGEEDWSPWMSTPDLAGTMSLLGVDCRWAHVRDSVKAFVTGQVDWAGFETLRDAEHKEEGQSHPAFRKVSRTDVRAALKRATEKIAPLLPGWSAAKPVGMRVVFKKGPNTLKIFVPVFYRTRFSLRTRAQLRIGTDNVIGRLSYLLRLVE